MNGFYGFGAEHLEALKAKQITQVMIAFERNEKANTAAEKLGAMLSERGMTAYRVTLPQGMTPTEYALQGPAAGKGLEALVRHATWIAGSRPVQEQLVPEVEKGFVDQPITKAADTEKAEHEVVLRFDDRRWRIRGLAKNLGYDHLHVNAMVALDGEGGAFHVDTLDLYQARARAVFCKLAASELRADEAEIKTDLGKVLLDLEGRQDTQIKAAMAIEAKVPEMTEGEREQAMKLLRDPKLIDRILEDFDKCGVIGERTNKLVGYLGAVSRKLHDPLALMIQSSSAAGKSSLMEAILAFVPDEERVSYSAMTGQSLFYMGATELAHKVLAIAEEEGVSQASYALKLLQSEKHLNIASTGKDPNTGRLVTQEYRVEGPVMLFMTTTSLKVDEELMNRCIVLTVDEGRGQTKAIHELQRRGQTLEGLLAHEEREVIVRLHQNAQRLLRPLRVVNPFAHELSFLDGPTRARRDHKKYLTLIQAVALLHQHQRPAKSVEHQGRRIEFFEVTKADIEVADKLTAEVLRSGDGDLPAQTRAVVDGVADLVKKLADEQRVKPHEIRFTRRQVREHLGLGNTQVRVHLARLVDLEHLVVHRGGRGRIVYVYDAEMAEKQANLAGCGGGVAAPLPRQVKPNDSERVAPRGGAKQEALLRGAPKVDRTRKSNGAAHT